MDKNRTVDNSNAPKTSNPPRMEVGRLTLDLSFFLIQSAREETTVSYVLTLPAEVAAASENPGRHRLGAPRGGRRGRLTDDRSRSRGRR